MAYKDPEKNREYMRNYMKGYYQKNKETIIERRKENYEDYLTYQREYHRTEK